MSDLHPIPYDRLRVGDLVRQFQTDVRDSLVTVAEYSPVENCVAYHVEFDGASLRTPNWGPSSHYSGSHTAWTTDATFAAEVRNRPSLLDIAYGRVSA